MVSRLKQPNLERKSKGKKRVIENPLSWSHMPGVTQQIDSKPITSCIIFVFIMNKTGILILILIILKLAVDLLDIIYKNPF